MKINQLNFPLNHPKFIVIDENFMYVYSSGFKDKIIRLLKIILPTFIFQIINIGKK